MRAPIGTVDIGIFRDEKTEVAPHRGPTIVVQPIGENLADTAEQDKVANKSTSDPTGTTPFESIPFTRTTPSSSFSVPSIALISIVRFQNLEA